MVKLRIMVADDHTIVREGLKQILEGHADMEVAGEAKDGNEVLEKARSTDYDIIILDIAMPGRGGLEVLKQLRVEMPELPILILSMYPEEQYALRALRAGANGYLTKESASEELIAAVRQVSRGRRYISSNVAENMASELMGGSKKRLHEKLSDRELLVLTAIASGKTLKMIANEFALSDKTISTYRSRILEKMRLRTNAELIRYAISEGLVP